MGQLKDENLMKKVALRLKGLRETAGLSQDQVYIETDIHIGRLETGKVNVSISTLSALCKFYEITLVDFFKKIDKDKWKRSAEAPPFQS